MKLSRCVPFIVVKPYSEFILQVGSKWHFISIIGIFDISENRIPETKQNEKNVAN